MLTRLPELVDVAESESEPVGAIEPIEPALATLPLLAPATGPCCEPIALPGEGIWLPMEEIGMLEPETVEALPEGVAAEAPGLGGAATEPLPWTEAEPATGTAPLEPETALVGTGGATTD